MKVTKLALLLILSINLLPAHAQNSSAGVNLPSTNFGSGSDRVRTADGVECSTHVGPRDKWGEIGVFTYTGPSTSTNSYFAGSSFSTISTPTNANSVGVYAKVVFNLDDKKTVLDCTALYQSELTRLQEENRALKQKVSPSFE